MALLVDDENGEDISFEVMTTDEEDLDWTAVNLAPAAIADLNPKVVIVFLEFFSIGREFEMGRRGLNPNLCDRARFWITNYLGCNEGKGQIIPVPRGNKS